MKKNYKKKNIGKAIKEAIILNNMTQREVADAVHISPQTLSGFIHDHRIPNVYDLIAITDLLNMDIYELLGLHKESYEVIDYMIYKKAQELDRQDKKLIISIIERLTKKS